MKDKTSIIRVQLLHPKIRDEVKATIEKAEQSFPDFIAIRVVQGLRTIEEQDALYAQGRTKPGKRVTNAKGGSSYHNYGLAVDFAILYDKDKNGSFESLSWDLIADMDRDGKADWMEVVKAFKEAGYEWGGDWTSIVDNPHFQKTFGFSWKQLLDKHNKRDFVPGTKYVNI